MGKEWKGMRVCQKIKSNQQGFTLVNTLLAFSVFLLLVAFLPMVIKTIKTEIPAESYRTDLFFEYIQKEIVQAKQLTVSGSTLNLTMNDGSSVQFQKFNSNIRRQVNGVGNEILLQQVEIVDYELVPNGVIVSVQTAGKKVEKRISMAPIIF